MSLNRRDDFPMVNRSIDEQPIIYFNSAATALKPQVVIDTITDYYTQSSVNIARSVDALTYETTHQFEQTRADVAAFMGSSDPRSIVFTRGTTAALNLVASSYGASHVQVGDQIVVSDSEHHANYVPWQQLAKRTGATLVLVPTNEDGIVTPEALAQVVTKQTKIVSLFHISNVMGARNDLKALAAIAHAVGAVFVCDGAQGIVHEAVNVEELDIDFYAFSGHKLFGPTGIGVLYGRYELLDQMPPIEFGGEMIDYVDVYDTTFAVAPGRFEAGTMPIAQVLGLGAAIRYVQGIGYETMQSHIEALTKQLVLGLQKLETVEVYNPNNTSSGVVSFNVIGVHPHDAAGIYDQQGMMIRAGQHCSQPSMRTLAQNATLRASLSIYNTADEVERFLKATEQAGDFLDVLF